MRDLEASFFESCFQRFKKCYSMYNRIWWSIFFLGHIKIWGICEASLEDTLELPEWNTHQTWKNFLQKLDFLQWSFVLSHIWRVCTINSGHYFKSYNIFFLCGFSTFFFLVNYIYNHSASFRFNRSLDDKMNFSGRWAFI